jgi:hypothetical protein
MEIMVCLLHNTVSSSFIQWTWWQRHKQLSLDLKTFGLKPLGNWIQSDIYFCLIMSAILCVGARISAFLRLRCSWQRKQYPILAVCEILAPVSCLDCCATCFVRNPSSLVLFLTACFHTYFRSLFNTNPDNVVINWAHVESSRLKWETRFKFLNAKRVSVLSHCSV